MAVKRWFPVSHDINHNPKVRKLVKDYGTAGLRIWLEILSIADRNDGEVDCTSEGAIRRLSSAAETRFKVVSSVVEALMKGGSIVLHDAMNHATRVVNWREYHRTREQIRRLPSEPSEPSEPNHTRPKPPISPKGEGGTLHDFKFEAFYKAYPKKRNRPAALKAWNKEAAHCIDVQEKIMATLEQHKKSRDWQKANGQYIPYPASWLNGKCWNDVLEAEEQEETREEALARMNRLRAKAGLKPYDPDGQRNSL